MLELPDVALPKSAEEVFGNQALAVERLKQLERSEELNPGGTIQDTELDLAEDGYEDYEDEEEEYDDDEEGDYNAEGVFENGEDDDDDGNGEDPEATLDS